MINLPNLRHGPLRAGQLWQNKNGRFAAALFVLLLTPISASAEVCDKANWDFEGVPTLLSVALISLGFLVFVLPVLLAVFAVLKKWRTVSLVFTFYFSAWILIGAKEWHLEWSGNDRIYNQMALEGCASPSRAPWFVAVTSILAVIMIWNVLRLRKQTLSK